MIEKVVRIEKNTEASDSVELSWFDMQKPNLSAITKNDINFIMKVKFTHLHENDVLVCENGYKIKVLKSEDDIYIFEFKNSLSFAKSSYEIGNRHQGIFLEDLKITVLDDISLSDIILNLKNDTNVEVIKTKGYFTANGKAHHEH